MICRDYMLRVCRRNPCKMRHEVERCTSDEENLCKKVFLTNDEVVEINLNIRPFRETVYKEMKRLAYVLRETYSEDLKVTTCTLNMLGECLFPCLACGTAVRNLVESTPVCNKCYVPLVENKINALRCGHAYCAYCIKRLSLTIEGPLPLLKCNQCQQWAVKFVLY
ncbi:uncharacterized protein LOC114940184 [Nylanderia fulva]|uniref:uncharacterized protein LOC114940184 n=1 Tax=Nylanderia fulva TaxID=613905 RepID=UPI0010FB2C70|nr:uncharacterized protein LOC114940184 [Nylanderia fulva]